MKLHRPSREAGFTLIEILIALTLFILIAISIYSVSNNILGAVSKNQLRSTAVSVIESEIETLRNMDFHDIGIVGGYPVGLLEAEKTITVKGVQFQLKTFVRAIDDPFDGLTGEDPNDTAPADYKLVEFEIGCLNCSVPIKPITITTTVGPPNLETSTNNGSLFIKVLGASGQPIADANVHVENNVLAPTITINDETNVSGMLQLVDIPTSTLSYEVTVSKNGYTSERTYAIGDPLNPNPINPHRTVASQSVTSLTLQIDKISTVNISSSDRFCAPVGDFDFKMEGKKLIGTAPDVPKYSQTLSTGALGSLSLNNTEWTTYTLTNLDATLDIVGSSPTSSFVIDPDSVVNVRFFVEAKNPSSLRVAVEDTAGGLIDDASVRIQGAGVDRTLISGRSSLEHTDWSGGKYSAKDTGVDVDSVPGEIRLLATGGLYPTSTVQTLTSETVDLGTSTTSFYGISWNPTSQPAETGSSSFRIQIATNNDNATWNFVGPDGTSGTYYTTSGTGVHSSNGNNRYMRYKVLLGTESATSTPSLTDIRFEFSSSCIPDGQVFTSGLSSGTYTVTVQKAGYQTYTNNAVSVSSGWQNLSATLTQ